MKQVTFLFFKTFFVIFCLFYCDLINAYNFEVNGICYSYINSTNNVEVAYKWTDLGSDPDPNYYYGDVVIPETVFYEGTLYNVTRIGYKAFSKSRNLLSVSLPNSVTYIDIKAFENCKVLTSVKMSDNISEIGNGAFHGCESIKSIEIPIGVTSIKYQVFQGCNSLTSMVIPNSVTSIGQYAFHGCAKLTSVIIPSSVNSIGSYAFEGCSSLVSVDLPNNITSIGQHTFANCSSLINVTIPNGVTNIGVEAFMGCSSLASVTISNSVQSIYMQAFANCSSLKNVFINALSPPKVGGYVFYGISSDAILYVPIGTKETYLKNSKSFELNDDWIKYFKEVVEINSQTSYTLSITSSGCGSASYSGTVIRGKTSSFTLNAGASATITFSPDNGYRIKSVKVNDSTASFSNNKYTISSINENTTVEVEFEAIPTTTYTLSITATGSGYASYNLNKIRNTTSSFTVGKGNTANIYFYPDNGYQIKSVKVDNTDVTSQLANNRYPVNNISKNTSVEVVFEAIPPTTYTLSITATGGGYASYTSKVRDKTSTFDVAKGSSPTIYFIPDNGYQIKSVKVDNIDVTSKLSGYSYTLSNISKNTNVVVVFEAISVKTYTLTIKASGSGSASYNSTVVRGETRTFTVNEGTNATITFTPDNGYRIKNVSVNNSNVTSNVSNNQYTISGINSNTTISVEFEVIPPTTYSLSITVSGNGSASYSGTSIRKETKTFTVEEGANAIISISPDDGYRVNIAKIEGNHTSNLYNNTLTFSNIRNNLTVQLEFLAIPTYTLSITSTGNGSASYNGTTIRNKTSSFTLNQDTSATISFTPDSGSRIKSVKVNNSIVTFSNNQYTINSIRRNTTVEVEFEAIPTTNYTLSISTSGNGSASYNGTTIRGKTSSFTVNEGTTVNISITPDNGYRIKSVKENNTLVTSYVLNGIYTINSLSRNTTVEVEFEEILQAFSAENVNYTVVSSDEHTIRLAKGEYGLTLEIPAKVSYQNAEWTVTGIDYGALANNSDLAAIIWYPDVMFTEQVSNPNLLLYVKQTQYAPNSIKNVVVNGNASNITLTDAASGNTFYCPQAFTAQKISYTHNYGMQTGIGEAKGWETIALPFDVQKVTHQSKGEIVPFAKWKSGDTTKPFWLMELNGSGWTMAESIKANTPYIISMPNNPEYKSGFLLNGSVTFLSENVAIAKTGVLNKAYYSDRTFVPSFSNLEKASNMLALNVLNDIESKTGGSIEGSSFISDLRPVHPFEAYMTTTSSTRSISINEGMATGIIELISAISDEDVLRIYNLNGQLIKIEEGMSMDEVTRELPAGVYIVNGKKMIIR